MRSTSAALQGALQGGSFSRQLLGDVYYGSTRVLQDVPIKDWSLNGDIDAEIKTAGAISIAYTDDFAQSVSPTQLTDALAPFGQEIRLYMVISAGSVYSERVPMGVYRIEAAPSATDAQMRFQNRVITIGSVVNLTLMDRFYGIRRNQFRSLEQVGILTSAWGEIGRISGLQLNRNVADVAIPSSTVYGRDRLAAVQTIASILGGRAYMTADGAISILPDTPGAAVITLEIGEDGVILDVAFSMESQDVYNNVFGDFEAVDGTPIHSEASIINGPLAVMGPYGYNSVAYPEDQKNFIKTQAAADTATANRLALVSTSTSFELPVQCILDPRVEVGDVVNVQRMDRLITGRVKKYTMGRTGPMSLTLGVLNDVAY
jgi:hypothetical protein